MRFDEPLGHVATIEGLWRAAERGRLSHALCFAGPDGVGKFLAAEWLAMGLLCERGPARPCGACGACKRVRVGSHPDALVVDAAARGEETLGVGAIAPREGTDAPNVHEFLALRAMEGGWRVVLVRDMERATHSAQNALLKILEEPGQQTLLVLVTSRPDALLATIHSRCVRVRMGRLADPDAAQILERNGVASDDARRLSRWSQGAPGVALALHERGVSKMRAAIEQLLAGEIDPSTCGEALASIDGKFEGKTPSAAARVRARTFLDLAVQVLADIARARAGADAAALAHGDIAERARELGCGGRLVELDERIEECLEARSDVDKNLAPDGPIDRAMLALYSLLRANPLATERVGLR